MFRFRVGIDWPWMSPSQGFHGESLGVSVLGFRKDIFHPGWRSLLRPVGWEGVGLAFFSLPIFRSMF